MSQTSAGWEESTSGAIKRRAIGAPTTIATREIQMAGRTFGEIPRFPGASRVFYYGYLTPAKMMPVSVHRDRYDSIALRLDKIRLEHAEYRDIEEQGIGHLVIREGTVLAKIHDLPAGLERLSPDSGGQKVIRLVELRLRPDHQVLITEGLFVTPGQVIARKYVSKQLRTLELAAGHRHGAIGGRSGANRASAERHGTGTSVAGK